MPNQEEIIENKGKRISSLIDRCAEGIKNIPKERIEQLRTRYLSDTRSYEEIAQEIRTLTEKVMKAELLVSRDVDSNVLEKSILLIGPMGSGKTNVGDILCEKCKMPRISLDRREQLPSLYEHQEEFDSPKDFEFFLTGTVLTSLTQPAIVDFGAGHSVYEDPAMFIEMQNLISRFDNVVLLLPSEDKEESLTILRERKGIKPGSREDIDNRHFIDMPCNYVLATTTIYTKDKTPEQVSDEIISQVKQKDSSNERLI